MKYIILVGLCGWLGYEIYVLIKTIIQKRKSKKQVENINSVEKEKQLIKLIDYFKLVECQKLEFVYKFLHLANFLILG